MSMQQSSLSLAHSCGGSLSLLPCCHEAPVLIQLVPDADRNLLKVVVDFLVNADCFGACSTTMHKG